MRVPRSLDCIQIKKSLTETEGEGDRGLDVWAQGGGAEKKRMQRAQIILLDAATGREKLAEVRGDRWGGP